MKTYDQYKNSGIEWLGSVPDKWQSYRAKFIFKKLSRPVRVHDEIITAFRDGEVTLRKNRRTEGFTNSAKEIGYQSVRKNDLVIHAMDGFAGAIGVSDSDGKCSPAYSICVPDKHANTKYYAYLLRHMALSGYVESLAKGIRERSTEFRYSEFKVLELPYPTIEEQTQISNYLDYKTSLIDNLIEKNENLIKTLEEKRSTIINQAVTKGLNLDVKMKDSGIKWVGQIPDHWGMKKLKRLGSFSKGRGITKDKITSEGLPCIRCGEIYTSYERITSEVFSFIDLETSKDSISVNKGVALFTGDGETVEEIGKCLVYNGNEELFVGGGINIFIPHGSKISHEFLSYSLNSPYMIYQKSRESKGEIIVHIYSSQLKDLKLIVPSYEEQIRISRYLNDKTSKIDKLIKQKCNINEHLREYRTALISNVVTGKVDVRDEEIPEILSQ